MYKIVFIKGQLTEIFFCWKFNIQRENSTKRLLRLNHSLTRWKSNILQKLCSQKRRKFQFNFYIFFFEIED